MANLKEIRNRITSISSTMKITSAMKMVSAAKLKKAQDAIVQMRPYANKLTELLRQLSTAMEGDSQSIYAEEKPVHRVLLVAITSNRGLCGAFNSNVIKKTLEIAGTDYAGKEVSVYAIGKKGKDVLTKKMEVSAYEHEIFDALNFENASRLAADLMQLFATDKYDKIELIYNRFKNAATQIITRENYLPILPETGEKTESTKQNYIFEPNREVIIEQLIPKSLKMQLFKALRDSYAAEHGARMTSMHKATDNASELKDELTLQYNKARQAAITGEILEIVGGAEALDN